jgi:hypothetical protein
MEGTHHTVVELRPLARQQHDPSNKRRGLDGLLGVCRYLSRMLDNVGAIVSGRRDGDHGVGSGEI